ncbi:RNA polymerase sigma factor [uncultured Friedmanniella sp.]|uniref:RNA polymerase sigma factor n=1 Tax=uncultured Friedmanniella sp. TaxID=335381 RepID=UPI0035CAA2B7
MDLPSDLAPMTGAAASSDVPGTLTTARPVDFDAWVAVVGSDLMRFAHATARGLDPADLVQDALVAVFMRWSRLSKPGQADAYARRVMVNSHISRWRKWGKRVSPVADPAAAEIVLGQEAAVDEVLAARQLLGTLPVTHRAAVFLRFYDDFSYAQIAAILGCRESTARSYVHRALTQLKSKLDKDTVR